MRRAFLLIRPEPSYRRDAFEAGLVAAGYKVESVGAPQARAGDVVVMWNKYGQNEELASAVKGRGVHVLVAENGYFGTDDQGRQMYALALHGHNGSGLWRVGPERRWKGTLAPWRAEGSHVLVCAQRGIGSRDMASPANWHQKMVTRLRAHTQRPIVVRMHPAGAVKPNPYSLEQQLAGAWAAVIWSSSSGVKALARGIPVFYDAPHFICESAACNDISKIENPPMPDREDAFHAMSWAQWSVDELTTGEPFKALLT